MNTNPSVFSRALYADEDPMRDTGPLAVVAGTVYTDLEQSTHGPGPGEVDLDLGELKEHLYVLQRGF